jgi:glycine betaine/choline ABC-type transport system substrate-binding protein
MKTDSRLRLLLALAAAAILALAVVACGSDDSSDEGDTSGSGGSSTLIQDNPDNHGVQITVGSKNFTEAFILGEIYAQALQAAGYDVKTDLNLGSEVIQQKALESGEVDAAPEYTSTALTSLFGLDADQVPAEAQAAYQKAKAEYAKEDLIAFPPTPFADSNAVGTLTSTAKDLDLTTVSDLQGKSQDLTLAGSPECRQRVDCLVGLEDDYGLTFKKFTPIDIALRYEVLDKDQADLSILFTSDAMLANSNKYTILEDDKGVFPAGNVLFVARKDTVNEAGPDFGKTVEAAQKDLTLDVMQELNARVDIDKEEPSDVAADYLKQAGLIK